MATTKKSRLKFLPPRIQLDQRSAMTGSFPTVARFSTDGRTGIYPVSFDDTKTINFQKNENVKDWFTYYLRPNYFEGYNSTPYQYNFATFLPPLKFHDNSDLQSEHLGSYSPVNPTNQFEVSGALFGYNGTTDRTLIQQLPGESIFDTCFPDGTERPFSLSLLAQPTWASGFRTIATLYDSSTTLRQWVIIYDPNLRQFIINMSDGSVTIGRNVFDSRIPVASDPFWIHLSYNGSKTANGIRVYFHSLATDTTIEPFSNPIGAIPLSSRPLGGDIILGKSTLVSPTSFEGNIGQFCYFNRVLSIEDFDKISKLNFRPLITETTDPNRVLTGTVMGTGLPGSSPFLNSNLSLRENEETSVEFYATANTIKGIGDSTPMVHFTPGQDGGPFRDNDQYAVDGKSDGDPFFAVGTTIADGGEGFTSPLWSKNKIEIDIGCASTSNFNVFMDRDNTPIVNSSYNMCYYNFSAKRWEGIGIGRWLDSGNTNFANTYNTAGFLGGLYDVPDYASPMVSGHDLINKLFEYQINAGRVSDIYGFPFDARYHATSSQLFPMSQVINKPFMVEKIVIDISASFSFDQNIQNGVLQPSTPYELTASFFPGAINNIFVLNQRKNAKISYFNESYVDSSHGVLTSSLPRTLKLSNISSNDTRVDTIRDIVTYGGVSSFASNVKTFVTRSSDVILGSIPFRAENPKQLFSRDIVIDTGVPLSKSLNALNWNQRLEFKLQPKCPSYLSGSLLDGESRKTLGAAGGGNNNLGLLFPSGRNQSSFIKQVDSVEEVPLIRYVTGNFDSNTPYILHPEDNLIVGWQQPSPSVLDDWYDITTGVGVAGSTSGTGRLSQISFAQGPAKLVLYGSYISEGEENNDSLNQLLSSESVHEIIGED